MINGWLVASVALNVVLVVAVVAQRWVIDRLAKETKRLYGEITNLTYEKQDEKHGN